MKKAICMLLPALLILLLWACPGLAESTEETLHRVALEYAGRVFDILYPWGGETPQDVETYETALAIANEAVGVLAKTEGEYPAAAMETYILRATVYETWGHYKEAAVDYHKAMALCPQYLSTHMALGNMYMAAAKENPAHYHDAIAWYSEVAARDPENEVALMYRAEAYLALGDIDRAMADIEADIVVKANHWEVHSIRAKVLLAAGDLTGALAALERAVGLEQHAGEVSTIEIAEGFQSLEAAILSAMDEAGE